MTNKCILALLVAVSSLNSLRAQDRSPVLVELFTSEGCSSCPPADKLLAEVAGPNVIVLSEHVDYWNHLGWADPFSSPVFSRRQEEYAQALHSGDVYTPQAVIDGQAIVVGGNRAQLKDAIARAASKKKLPLTLEVGRAGDIVSARVDGWEKSPGADIYFALVENKVHSRVGGGENGGRTLEHVGVIRLLRESAETAASFHMNRTWGANGLSVVVFVQQRASQKIVAAAQKSL